MMTEAGLMTDAGSVSSEHPKLAVVVPFYNEQDNIERMHAAIVAAVEPLRVAFEIVFVDDGSTDATPRLARAIARRDPRVRVVRFRRNYGQTPAMAAGIALATADIVVTMDGDLQNDPEDIRAFLAEIDAGSDIVVGWRHDRKDKWLSRKLPSRIANWLIGKVTRVPIRDNGCSLKAFRASVIKHIPLYSEMHRFIPAMASMAGPRLVELKVRHHARQFGQSKYGLSRVYKVLLDLMVIKTVATFASRPMRWFALLALPFALGGMLSLGVALWTWADPSRALPLPAAGTGVLLLASAFIMLCSGAIAELVYKTGDLREQEFSQLTARVWGQGDQG